MHDTVINNAFFALLAVGGSVLGLEAVRQVVFAPSLQVGSTFAHFASAVIFWA